jgi:gamma-glutamylcyclotransferase (GGCT)/AIG2-like uncharacterized protein YtfP
MKLFTYGTLRRGERNHWVLGMGVTKFITDDFLDDAEPCGFWGDIPLIRAGEGPVSGEVYEIDEHALIFLDRFEGTDRGLYERRKAVTNSGIEAWVYFPGEELLKQG